MPKKELGDWTLAPHALPREMLDVLDELVELFDKCHGDEQPWDRESVLERLLISYLAQLRTEACDTPMTHTEERHHEDPA